MKNLTPLTDNEAKMINGGYLGIVLAIMAMAYQYGKDAAERERRNNS